MSTLPPIAPIHLGGTTQNSNICSCDVSSRRSTLKTTISGLHPSQKREAGLRRNGLPQQPALTFGETAQFRNSFMQNVCIDMIKAGLHKSFRELFMLIERQKEDRLRAGPESVMWTMTMLPNEHEKLEMLKSHLTQAEIHSRNNERLKVYKCQHQLASYFLEQGDRWLADYFFEQCLETSRTIFTDGGHTLAEAHCNMGLSLKESGLFFEAVEQFEKFHELTISQTEWYTPAGNLLHTEACDMLALVYTTIAAQANKRGDTAMTVNYQQLSYKAAQEGKDRSRNSEAAYKLGIAYESNGEHDKAIEYLTICFKISEGCGDDVCRCKTYEALAKSYQSKGMLEESIKYLQKFMELAEKSNDEKSTASACSALGAMFNSLGQYDQAVDYFNKSYNISRSLGDTQTIGESRVHFGIATAHRMLQSYNAHVQCLPVSHECTTRLIDWKDSRADELMSDACDVDLGTTSQTDNDGSVPVETSHHNDLNEEEERRRKEAEEQEEEETEE